MKLNLKRFKVKNENVEVKKRLSESFKDPEKLLHLLVTLKKMKP